MSQSITISDDSREMLRRMSYKKYAPATPSGEPGDEEPTPESVIEELIRRHYRRSGAEEYFGPVPPRDFSNFSNFSTEF